MKGNTGRIADVDLSSGTVSILQLPEETYRRYIGGSAWPPDSSGTGRFFRRSPFSRSDSDSDERSADRRQTLRRQPNERDRAFAADRRNRGILLRRPFSPGAQACRVRRSDFIRQSKESSVLLIENESVSVRDAGNLWGMGVLGARGSSKKPTEKSQRPWSSVRPVKTEFPLPASSTKPIMPSAGAAWAPSWAPRT